MKRERCLNPKKDKGGRNRFSVSEKRYPFSTKLEKVSCGEESWRKGHLLGNSSNEVERTIF